jgi:hypothetical protein
MQQEDLLSELEKTPVLTHLDTKQQTEVEEVLKMPGLKHIYGLMLGSRQAYYAALAATRMHNMETVSRASVLQGTISGIELFRDTLLTLTVPNVEQNNKEQNNAAS